MLIEQIIEFEVRRARPPDRICTTSTIGYFCDMTKQKSLRNIIKWIILLFTAKILQELNYLTSPIWAKRPTKFNPKVHDFKRVLDLNCK